MAKFSLVAMPNGMSQFSIDGVDYTGQFSAISFDCAPGQVPVLSMMMNASGEIAGEGIIQVYRPASDIAQWLEQLDPAAIEREALGSLGWGDAQSVGAAIMALLIRLAKENEDGRTEPGATREDGGAGLHGGHCSDHAEQLGLGLG